MFRSILSQSRKTLTSLNLKSNYCSKPRLFPEINQMTLVGRLINDAVSLPSGTNNLTVKTCDASVEKYQILNVHTRGFETAKAGQRVHVSGKLQSVPVDLENGKRRDSISVLARQIFILENTATNDINDVYMVANVANVNKINDGPLILKLATHFYRDTDDGGGQTKANFRSVFVCDKHDSVLESKAHFHSVFVYDEHLKHVGENLKVSDKVAVHGELRSHAHTLSDGKRFYTGVIVAKKIDKVQRRGQQIDHDDVEHEANNYYN